MCATIRLDDVCIAYQNVKLTEAHLSSSFAGAVDGENVTGLWHGYGLLYDIPIQGKRHFQRKRLVYQFFSSFPF